MKSSSKFFPVALMQTEYWNQYSEDVYLLKPNTSADRTVELALTRLYKSQEGINNEHKPAFVFVHDTYENRGCWMSDHESLLSSIIESGGDVWIYEMRGHGLSPKNKSYLKNTLNDVARFDLPAVQTFIYELNSSQAVWIGRGEGGIAILRSIESECLQKDNIKHLHLLSMERFHWARRYWIPLWGSFVRLLNRKTYFTKAHLPETEFRSVWKQLKKEKSLLGSKRTIDGKNRLFKQLINVEVPVLFWLKSEPQERFKKWFLGDSVNAAEYSDDVFMRKLVDSINN